MDRGNDGKVFRYMQHVFLSNYPCLEHQNHVNLEHLEPLHIHLLFKHLLIEREREIEDGGGEMVGEKKRESGGGER